MPLKLPEPQVPQLYREDARRKYWTQRCSCSCRGTYFGMCMNFAQYEPPASKQEIPESKAGWDEEKISHMAVQSSWGGWATVQASVRQPCWPPG